MQAHLSLSEPALEDVTQQILCSRRITRKDQHLLMNLLFNNNLGEKEHTLINQIFDALRKGLVKVVD